MPTLFSYKRWKVKRENLRVGELVLLVYPGNFKNDYCIAKITAVHPSDDNLVRKVTVSYRKKDAREPASTYKFRPLISEEVEVHRLQKLHLIDEDLYNASMEADKVIEVNGGEANLVVSGKEVLGAVADVIGEEEECGIGLQVRRLDLLGDQDGVVQQ